MRVELVSRDLFVAAAAPLLRAAWEPPAVHYSAAHFRATLRRRGCNASMLSTACSGQSGFPCRMFCLRAQTRTCSAGPSS